MCCIKAIPHFWFKCECAHMEWHKTFLKLNYKTRTDLVYSNCTKSVWLRSPKGGYLLWMSCCKCTHRWDTQCFWPLGDGYCESPLLMATSPQLDESWPAVIVCFYNSGPHSHIRWMRQSSFSGGFSMTASRKHMHTQTHCIILFVCVWLLNEGTYFSDTFAD